MNWSAVFAVAELIGASGVIATLFYLALQVKQNARSVRRVAYQDQNAHHQFTDGVLSEHQWLDISAPIPRLLANAGDRDMWEIVKGSFHEDFQHMVEDTAAAGPRSD